MLIVTLSSACGRKISMREEIKPVSLKVQDWIPSPGWSSVTMVMEELTPLVEYWNVPA